MATIHCEAIDKKVNETEAEIAKAQNIENTELKEFFISELTRRLDELKVERDRIVVSQSRETIYMRLFGETVKKGKVPARALAACLGGFQGFADNLTYAMLRKPSSRGRIPNYIRDFAGFDAIAANPGSFEIVLEKQYEQIELDHTKLNPVLFELFNIIDMSNDDNLLLETLAPYGKRAVMKYRDWLEDICENDVNVDMRWVDNAASVRNSEIRSSNGRHVIKLLESIDSINDDESMYYGELTGINVRNLSFEMSVESEGIIKGKGNRETLVGISDRIGDNIKATLVKNIMSSRAGFENVTWYLLRVD